MILASLAVNTDTVVGLEPKLEQLVQALSLIILIASFLIYFTLGISYCKSA